MTRDGRAATEKVPASKGVRTLSVCGGLVVLGCLGLFALLQSPAMWHSDSLIQHRFPEIFDPIASLFPARWLNHDSGSRLALVDLFLFVAIMALLFGVLIYAFKAVCRPGAFLATDGRVALRMILVYTALSLAIVLFVRGILTTDIFLYIWYSRIWVEHGVSPYVHVPIEFAAYDTANWLQWVYWKDTPNAYGPLWTILAVGVYKVGQLGDGDIVNHLLGLRILTDLFHLLNVWLVWNIMGLLVRKYAYALDSIGKWLRGPDGEQPTPGMEAESQAGDSPGGRSLGVQVAATLFYAWSPLTLVEFGIGGHNDAPMMCFVLVAVWLHLLGRWRWAACALTLAALVKLSALAFLPAYLWLLLWENLRAFQGDSRGRRLLSAAWRLAQAGAIVVAAFALCYAPFWGGAGTLTTLDSNAASGFFLHSLGATIVKQVPAAISAVAYALGLQGDGWSAGAVRDVIRIPVLWIGRLVVLIVALVVTWKAWDMGRTIWAWGWTVFALLTLGQAWFWPWYVTWLIVPSALAGSARLRNATLLLSATSIATYLLDKLVAAHSPEPLIWGGAIVMGPPLIYVAVSLLLERRKKRSGVKHHRTAGPAERQVATTQG